MITLLFTAIRASEERLNPGTAGRHWVVIVGKWSNYFWQIRCQVRIALSKNSRVKHLWGDRGNICNLTNEATLGSSEHITLFFFERRVKKDLLTE
jgi:hypothetical protein